MVLLNEPVIKYRDFFTYFTLTQPKQVGRLTPLGHMDDAILIVSNKFCFCLSSTLVNVFLIEPWQHAGLVYEES